MTQHHTTEQWDVLAVISLWFDGMGPTELYICSLKIISTNIGTIARRISGSALLKYAQG